MKSIVFLVMLALCACQQQENCTSRVQIVGAEPRTTSRHAVCDKYSVLSLHETSEGLLVVCQCVIPLDAGIGMTSNTEVTKPVSVTDILVGH